MNDKRKEYLKKWREDNKEHIRKYKKEYAKTHDSSFKKLQDKYKQLQQENNQLKEQKEELTNMVCNKVLASYEYSSPLKDSLNEANLKIIALEESKYITELENKQLKEVIDEVREYINSKVISNGEIIDQLRKIEVKELLQILDKVKD